MSSPVGVGILKNWASASQALVGSALDTKSLHFQDVGLTVASVDASRLELRRTDSDDRFVFDLRGAEYEPGRVTGFAFLTIKFKNGGSLTLREEHA